MLGILLMPYDSHAQEAGEGSKARAIFCGADGALDRLRRVDAYLDERMRAVDSMIAEMLDDHGDERSSLGIRMHGAPPYHIPVVVHLVHDDGGENLSDDQVRAAIENLNDAFANIGAYDSTSGVAVGIRFCLACRDERGMESSGITRIRSALTEMVMERDDVELKSLCRWDQSKYLNIWVVRSIVSLSDGESVSGYAYAPAVHGMVRDGIVVEARLLEDGPDPVKILVHELGHYLGLYHTFQAGCPNRDCLRDGDKVCDTPPDTSNAPLPCGAIANSCTTDADDTSRGNPFRAMSIGGTGDQNDLPDNYMDYGLQKCRSAFTSGQRERMLAMLKMARASLLTSNGCDDRCVAGLRSSCTIEAQMAIDAGAAHSHRSAPRLVSDSADAFTLHAPIPNPNESSAEIRYALAAHGPVRLTLLDMMGREVIELHEGIGDPGCYAIEVDTSELPSGIYLTVLECNTAIATQRMVVQR